MPRKRKTQTTPAGNEIPIPKRSDYLRDLDKVTDPERKRERRDQQKPG
jgi:hypothetical protein